MSKWVHRWKTCRKHPGHSKYSAKVSHLGGKMWCGCFQMQMFVFWWLTSPALRSSKHKGCIFWTIPKWSMSLFKRVGGLAESQKRQLIKALERISLASSWPSSRGWQRASAWWVQFTTVCKFEDGTSKSSSCKSLGTVCVWETIQLVLIFCYLKMCVKLWGNVYILTGMKFDQLLQVDKFPSEKAGPMWSSSLTLDFLTSRWLGFFHEDVIIEFAQH